MLALRQNIEVHSPHDPVDCLALGIPPFRGRIAIRRRDAREGEAPEI